MSNKYLSEYPPSLSLSEIREDIKKRKDIAFCFMGDNRGSLMIVDKDGFIINIRDGIKFNAISSIDKNSNHELWAYLGDMDRSMFMQMSVNTMMYLYLNNYNYLYKNNIDIFKNNI